MSPGARGRLKGMHLDLSTCVIGPVMAAADLDRARAFYEGTLGLRPRTENEHLSVYPCGATTLAIYISPDHAGRCTATMAAWSVPDVAAAREALEGRGVTFEDYSDPGNAFFRDPDGNTIVLVSADA